MSSCILPVAFRFVAPADLRFMGCQSELQRTRRTRHDPSFPLSLVLCPVLTRSTAACPPPGRNRPGAARPTTRIMVGTSGASRSSTGIPALAADFSFDDTRGGRYNRLIGVGDSACLARSRRGACPGSPDVICDPTCTLRGEVTHHARDPRTPRTRHL